MSFVWSSLYYFFLLEIFFATCLLFNSTSNVIIKLNNFLNKNYYYSWLKHLILFILIILFIESLKQTSTYRSHQDMSRLDTCNIILKTYRSERNSYLSGISIYLYFIIKKLSNIKSIKNE